MTFQILELELPVGSGSENSSTASTAISYVMTFSEVFYRFWIRMYFREFNPGRNVRWNSESGGRVRECYAWTKYVHTSPTEEYHNQ